MSICNLTVQNFREIVENSSTHPSCFIQRTKSWNFPWLNQVVSNFILASAVQGQSITLVTGGSTRQELFSLLMSCQTLKAYFLKSVNLLYFFHKCFRISYPIPTLKSTAPLSRIIKEFGTFHGKKASEKGVCTFFRPLMFLG